jgi:uncharacterized BrkB/YihY/UPF0761 family membrane protein
LDRELSVSKALRRDIALVLGTIILHAIRLPFLVVEERRALRRLKRRFECETQSSVGVSVAVAFWVSLTWFFVTRSLAGASFTIRRTISIVCFAALSSIIIVATILPFTFTLPLPLSVFGFIPILVTLVI